MKRFFLPMLMWLFLSSPAMSAQTSVKVIALFSDKALMLVNGEQKLMKKGETLHGVTLLSSSGRGALVRLGNGREMKLDINQAISSSFKKARKDKLTVYADRAGMFRLSGKINGKSTEFLLDTGATYVAISEVEADNLGIAYENGRQSPVSTANGIVTAWNIKLDSVTIGGITIPQVDASVVPGSSPRVALLGMSFLQHLTLQRDGAAMILQQKYKQ